MIEFSAACYSVHTAQKDECGLNTRLIKDIAVEKMRIKMYIKIDIKKLDRSGENFD